MKVKKCGGAFAWVRTPANPLRFSPQSSRASLCCKGRVEEEIGLFGAFGSGVPGAITPGSILEQMSTEHP